MQVQAGAGAPRTLVVRITSRVPTDSSVQLITLDDVTSAEIRVQRTDGTVDALAVDLIEGETLGVEDDPETEEDEDQVYATRVTVTRELVETDFPLVATLRAIVRVTNPDGDFDSEPFTINVVSAMLGGQGNEVGEVALAATG